MTTQPVIVKHECVECNELFPEDVMEERAPGVWFCKVHPVSALSTNVARFSVEEVVTAVKKTHGRLFLAARELGCHGRTLEKYAQRHVEVREAIAEAEGMMLDAAEITVEQGVQRGESWATCFLLKCKGKDRGWVERAEVTGKGGGAMALQVVTGVPRPPAVEGGA